MMILRPDLLLHPKIPKPLHGLSPREVKGQEWWDKQRQAAYAKLHYHCWACGIPNHEALFHSWLEAHEVYDYDYANGVLTFKEVCALCHACHNYIHNGRMRALVRKGEMEPEKEKAILEHGESVLRSAGLPLRPEPPLSCAPWAKWRMVIEGRTYPARFKTRTAWLLHYEQA